MRSKTGVAFTGKRLALTYIRQEKLYGGVEKKETGEDVVDEHCDNIQQYGSIEIKKQGRKGNRIGQVASLEKQQCQRI